jgi:hypothetical protein
MADTKISALTGATTPVAGTEVLPIVQSGTTVNVSIANLTAGRNVTGNIFYAGFSNVAAAGTTTTLTSSSTPNWVVTGSGGQTFKLPDATTLSPGILYTFNNNQSSGAITVVNNSSTTVATIQSGGFITISLLTNSIAAGTWDYHFGAPANVSWSTNTFDYPGSITSATWNGATVAVNRGGTGVTTSSGTGSVVLNNTPTLTTPAITNPTVTNYVETLYAPSAGSAFTISLANGTIQEISLNANGTITLPSSVAGKSFTIIVTYSGSYSLTWSGGGTLKWAGGTTPTATSTSGKYDIFNFYQDGTNTYGSVYGLNY